MFILDWLATLNAFSEAYSEPSQTSKMELFVKIINGWKPLTFLTKSSILDVRPGFDYASTFFSGLDFLLQVLELYRPQTFCK